MRTRLQRYGIAFLAVLVAAVIRSALIPILGYRYGFTFFLVSTFVSGRYAGLGPSLFTLVAGAVSATALHFIPPDQHFDPSFQGAMFVYFILGGVVVLLCNSEHKVRRALQKEIADRKSIEAELRESRQQLLLAIEAAQLGTWQLDMRTSQVKWSGLMEPMHGYTPGTFGGTLAEAVAHDHPEDREQILRDISNHQGTVRRAYRVMHPNGRTRWIQGLGQTLMDDSGQPVQMHGVCLDVTEQKESETALKHAEERFRLLATHAPVGIFQTDTEGRFVFVNQTWCEIAGARPEDALGDTGLKFLHANDRQRCKDEWHECISQGHNYQAEFRLINQKGGFRWVISSAVPMLDASGTLTGYIGTVVDVTERKAAEDAVRASELRLREREERIRLAVESTNIGTFDFNPVTGERNWSDRAKLMWGLSPDADVTNVSFLDRLHPEDRQRADRAVQKALDPSGDGAYDIDCRVIWPDGTVHSFIAKGQTLFEGEMPNRRAVRFLGTVLDITERKHAEEIIRVSENRLRAIMDNTSAVIYLKDCHCRYLMINRRYEELFHVVQQQIVGKTDACAFPAEVMAAFQANDRKVLDTGQPLEFEEVVPHADGPHTYTTAMFPIKDASGIVVGVGGISADISDRKKVGSALEAEQEMLRHTIKLQDQERQLVAYEIHDGLVQYATGALMQLESTRNEEKSEALADQIEMVVNILRKTVEEGRRIINGIHTTVLDDCGVGAAIQQLIEDEERAHVRIEFVKDENLGRMAPSIELALYHITQEALTNVHKHSQSPKARIEIVQHKDRVQLEVRDWGVGFASSAASNEVHGLRGMTERARIAGGMCRIESTPGKGTRVVADLPYLAPPDPTVLKNGTIAV